MHDESEEIPQSQEHKIPRVLIYIFIVLLLGGLLAFVQNWNGTQGWLDRGYWHKLQQAADTTYPFEKKEADLNPKISS